jgi:competence protein ComEC
MPPEEAQLLTGILLGAHGHLPPRLRDAFSDTGTAHIVAASGMNVGFVALISLGLFRLLRLPRRFALFLTLPILTFYTLVAGATPSLLRADIMLSVLLLGQLLDREASIANTVAFAALLLLLIDPLQLWDAGFQLSFAAVIGILAILPLMEPTVKRIQGLSVGRNRRSSRWIEQIVYALVSAVALSFAAQISTAPLGAYYFNRLPLIGLLTNALVVPVLALLMTVGFAVWGVAVLWLSAAQALTAVVLRPLLTYIVGVVLFCTNVPCAVLNVPSPPAVLIVLYYGLLAALLFWLHELRLRALSLRTITFTDPYAAEWERRGA